MGEMKLENKPFVLPKNIRQMGTPGELQKVYVEDYVHTYLHSFLKEKYKEDTLRAALLLGTSVSQEDTTYAFIKGAVACDFSHLHEEISADLTNAMASFFPEWDMLGWYVCAQGVDAHIQSEIKHYYAARAEQRPQYLIYEDMLEMETDLFVWEQNALHKLTGYYIYYERNPQMQEFLIHEKKGRPQEMPSFSDASVLYDAGQQVFDDTEGRHFYATESHISRVRERRELQTATQRELDRAAQQATQVESWRGGYTTGDSEPSIRYRRKTERQIKAAAAREVAEMAEESRWSDSREMTEQRRRGGAAEERTDRAEMKKQMRQQAAHKPRPGFVQKMAYAACAIVLILLAAMGISQFDNYQSIRNLQEAISSTLIPVREHAVEQDKDEEEVLPATGTVERDDRGVEDDGQNTKQTTNSNEEGDGQSMKQDGQGESGGDRNTNQGAQDSGQDSQNPGQQERIPTDLNENNHAQGGGQTDAQAQPAKTQTSAEAQTSTKEQTSAETQASIKTQASTKTQSPTASSYYTVKKGDSLLSISRAVYENENMVEQICALNGLQNTNMIYEGQKLKMS